MIIFGGRRCWDPNTGKVLLLYHDMTNHLEITNHVKQQQHPKLLLPILIPHPHPPNLTVVIINVDGNRFHYLADPLIIIIICHLSLT